MKISMNKSMASKVSVLTLVLLFVFVTSAYAVTPAAPPGGLSWQAGADKVMSWLLYLIPIGAGFYCTWLWWTGIFGVEDRNKKAETKEHILSVLKYSAMTWIGNAVIKGILSALGIV